jgi:hypothetical protein
MKKSLLATAISGAMISTAFAQPPTTTQLDIGTGNIVFPCPSTPNTPSPAPAWIGGQLTVTTPSNTTINGGLCLDLSPNVPSTVALDFVNPTGPVGAGGTTLNSGEIRIWTDWGGTTGWLYYGTIDASVTNISCPGILSGPTFPGGLLPSGTPACSANLLGMPADIYMQ